MWKNDARYGWCLTCGRWVEIDTIEGEYLPPHERYNGTGYLRWQPCKGSAHLATQIRTGRDILKKDNKLKPPVSREEYEEE